MVVDSEGRPFRKFPESYRPTLQQQVDVWNRRQRHATTTTKPTTNSTMMVHTANHHMESRGKKEESRDALSKTPRTRNIPRKPNASTINQPWKEKLLQYEKDNDPTTFRNLMLESKPDLIAWLHQHQHCYPNFTQRSKSTCRMDTTEAKIPSTT